MNDEKTTRCPHCGRPAEEALTTTQRVIITARGLEPKPGHDPQTVTMILCAKCDSGRVGCVR